MKIYSIIIVLIISTICCSTNDIGNANIYRLHDIWALESINGEKFVRDEQSGKHPVLEIYVKDERVHGNAGCNTINGKVKIDGNKISFSQIIMTEMACPGDLEYRFLSALGSINNYKIERLKLYLYEGVEEKLVFRKVD
jgi:heat shock protein HslJ